MGTAVAGNRPVLIPHVGSCHYGQGITLYTQSRNFASFTESWALVALSTVPTAVCSLSRKVDYSTANGWHADIHTRPRPDVHKHAEAASAAQVLPLLSLGDHRSKQGPAEGGIGVDGGKGFAMYRANLHSETIA